VTVRVSYRGWLAADEQTSSGTSQQFSQQRLRPTVHNYSEHARTGASSKQTDDQRNTPLATPCVRGCRPIPASTPAEYQPSQSPDRPTSAARAVVSCWSSRPLPATPCALPTHCLPIRKVNNFCSPRGALYCTASK